MTKIKSLFDCCDKVKELPPEPLPTRISKNIRKDGKLFTITVERKSKK